MLPFPMFPKRPSRSLQDKELDLLSMLHTRMKYFEIIRHMHTKTVENHTYNMKFS